MNNVKRPWSDHAYIQDGLGYAVNNGIPALLAVGDMTSRAEVRSVLKDLVSKGNLESGQHLSLPKGTPFNIEEENPVRVRSLKIP